ncbi:MAG TPA: bifunctional folylpolyglutamate synthase/dihydrofolate synthase [Clostridiales bacterium]|nr:bifunctional folylpolyglutamate synthase/dihydrofolate synthase [Clostridiales bacterium]
MDYTQSLEYIESLKQSGMKWGFDRLRNILNLCGNPENSLRFIHIAGTNGKGSTAKMIQSILTAAGYRTGLFTSPVVTGYRDIITIDGQAVTENEFAELTGYLSSLQTNAGEDVNLSEFEFCTVLALLHFARQKTDICVIECGLGGRDDATNIIPPPLAAVITPVSLDHTNILGSTVEEIAAKKCGIIKPPCVVVTSPDQDDSALAVILETAAKYGLTVRIPSEATVKPIEFKLGLTRFEYDGMEITLPLTGDFQISNCLTAIETVKSLEKTGINPSKEQIIKGLRESIVPCRQEVASRSPLIILDGGHNPQAVAALAKTLESFGIKGLVLVAGMLADKEVSKCLKLLTPYCAKIICCTPENPRALPAAELAEIARQSAPSTTEILVEETPLKALESALRTPEKPILIAGSFYVASAVRTILLHSKN